MNRDVDATTSLALHLRGIGSGFVRMRGGIEDLRDGDIKFVEWMLLRYSEVLHRSIETRDLAQVEVAAAGLGEFLDYELRQSRGSRFAAGEAQGIATTLEMSKRAFGLTALAWIEYRRAEYGWTGEQIDSMFEAIAHRMGLGDDIGSIVLHAIDYAFEDRTQWVWWEFEARAPERGGAVHYEESVQTAALRLAKGRPIDLSSRLDRGDVDAALAVRALATSMKGKAEREPEFAGTVPSLESAIQAAIQIERESVIAAPIESQRVAQFAGALETAWRANRQTTFQMRSHDHRIPRTLDAVSLGFNRYVPKSYFSATHVHADPEDLGRQIGQGMATGEVNFALSGLIAECPTIQVDRPQTLQTVFAAVSDLQRQGLKAAINVFGGLDFRWHLDASPRAWSHDKPTIDLGGGLTAMWMPSETDMVIVGDIDGLLLLHTAPGDLSNGQQYIASDQLRLRVTQITPSDAERIASETEPAEFDADDVRRSVQLEVYEQIALEILDRDHAIVIVSEDPKSEVQSTD